MHSVLMPDAMEYEPSSRSIRSSMNISAIVSRSESGGWANKRKLLPFIGKIFPNTSYHGRQPRGICAWHPHSPTETEGGGSSWSTTMRRPR